MSDLREKKPARLARRNHWKRRAGRPEQLFGLIRRSTDSKSTGPWLRSGCRAGPQPWRLNSSPNAPAASRSTADRRRARPLPSVARQPAQAGQTAHQRPTRAPSPRLWQPREKAYAHPGLNSGGLRIPSASLWVNCVCGGSRAMFGVSPAKPDLRGGPNRFEERRFGLQRITGVVDPGRETMKQRHQVRASVRGGPVTECRQDKPSLDPDFGRLGIASDMLIEQRDRQLCNSTDDEFSYLIVAHSRPRNDRPLTIIAQTRFAVQREARSGASFTGRGNVNVAPLRRLYRPPPFPTLIRNISRVRA